VGVPGEKEFDRLLTYKQLKPGVSHQVILERRWIGSVFPYGGRASSSV
jgi:hypothetical protein